MDELRFRQIHLDFHTSGDIDRIGAGFDADQFAQTLADASVNSVTCFARCHHGWVYYDSAGFPELIHPGLASPKLLESQIEACRRRGIRVPVYTTVQWDKYQAEAHPEWLMRNPDGTPAGQSVFEAGFYNSLCVNTPYRDFLADHIRDLFKAIPDPDGLFLDIVQERECSCVYCRRGMEKEGLQPHLEADRKSYARKMINEFKFWTTSLIREHSPDCTVFYNCQAVQQHSRGAYSHIEVESLPSGAWGYDHFAFESRCVRKLGLDFLGQTGKFHTAWGDFHSFKTEEALEYECFRMLALNAKCMIGDQLVPAGKLCESVYSLIGRVYSQVARKEEWCRGAEAVCDTAVFDPREFYPACRFDHPEALLGAMKMLEQTGGQFDIIDSSMNFDDYRLLVLPDIIPVSGEFGRRLDQFISGGGSVILSALSGFQSEDRSPGFAGMPVTFNQDQQTDLSGQPLYGRFDQMRNSFANYILPAGEIGTGLPETEHVMYIRNPDVTPADGSQVLAHTVAPEFYRDYRHFCSHRQAPSSGKTEGAGIVRRGNVIYFAHDIFTQYQLRSPRWLKIMFKNAVNMLTLPMLTHNGPSTLLTAVNRQTNEKRDVLHLLHYIPKRSCRTMDIIEDRIPLHNVSVSLGTGKNISKVRLVPENVPVEFDSEGGRIRFTVDVVNGHQMAELSWE